MTARAENDQRRGGQREQRHRRRHRLGLRGRWVCFGLSNSFELESTVWCLAEIAVRGLVQEIKRGKVMMMRWDNDCPRGSGTGNVGDDRVRAAGIRPN